MRNEYTFLNVNDVKVALASGDYEQISSSREHHASEIGHQRMREMPLRQAPPVDEVYALLRYRQDASVADQNLPDRTFLEMRLDGRVFL